MSNPKANLPVPLLDVQAIADAGLDPSTVQATEDRVRDKIRAATLQPTSPRPRGLLGWSRVRPGAAIVVGGLLLVGGTAIAATAPWSPQLGDDHRGRPSAATDPAPTKLAQSMAVLQRAQSVRDRGPRVERLLKVLPAEVLASVHTDSIRLIANRADGVSVLAIADQGSVTDQLCLLQSYEYAWRNGQRHQSYSAGAKCGTVEDVASGRLITGAQWDGRLGTSGLVPDDVTRVEIPLAGGPTISADVHDNTFYVDIATPRGRFDRSEIRWTKKNGAVEKIEIDN